MGLNGQTGKTGVNARVHVDVVSRPGSVHVYGMCGHLLLVQVLSTSHVHALYISVQVIH